MGCLELSVSLKNFLEGSVTGPSESTQKIGWQ